MPPFNQESQGFNATPAVSIVICTHNYGHWIGDAISSVIKQSYQNKRIAIVDDASTDDTYDRIKDTLTYDIGNLTENEEQLHGKIRDVELFYWKTQHALGPSAARNIAIQKLWSKTDIFGILDADDWFLPGKIEKCVAKLVENPQMIGSVYTDYVTYNTHTEAYTRCFKEPCSFEKLLQKCIVHSGVFIWKHVLDQVGLFDEVLRTAEDYDLHLRVAEKFIIAHIPEALSMIRVGNWNSTGTVDESRRRTDFQRVMMKVQERHASHSTG